MQHALTFGILIWQICRADLYSFDQFWTPKFPTGSHTLSGVAIAESRKCESCPLSTSVFITQRGNTSVSPVLVFNAEDGSLMGAWGDDFIGVDATTKTWGSHGIAIEHCTIPCVQTSLYEHSFSRIYVEDFTNHTVTAFDSSGSELFQLGTSGTSGNRTSPIQFGNVADGSIIPAQHPSQNSQVYLSDGDGGYDNRVVKLLVANGNTPVITTAWATKAIFKDPHSVTYHRSGLLIIADRGHHSLRLLNSTTGEDLGFWDCGLNFGTEGTPFGVRTLFTEMYDILFIASMDNPQDGKFQRISIVEVSELMTKRSDARCKLLQTLHIDPAKYSGPHLLGVAPNGDVYAALVSDSPRSTVLRYKKMF